MNINDFKENRPLSKTEQLYVYKQPNQINAQAGLIGYLRADFGSNGKEFWSTWEEFNKDLKTSEFANVFDDVIHTLRCENNFLAGLSKMKSFCNGKEEYCIDKERSHYGVRVDVEKYSFLFRLFPYKGDYNCYCCCFIKEYLDEHLMKASKGIRFIDSHYNELFRIADGGIVVISEPSGKSYERTCRYLDDYHIFVGCNVFHICEFAEKMESNNNKVEPSDGKE